MHELQPQELHPQELHPHELQPHEFSLETERIKSKRSKKFVFVLRSVSVLFAKIERSKTNKTLFVLFIGSPLVFLWH